MRDLVVKNLTSFSQIHTTTPKATFYTFFSLEGEIDSLQLAKKILHKTQVGLAPGCAFGQGGEGFLRLCFARSQDQMQNAFDRLSIYFK